jgi:hypothetical protein
MSIGLDRKWDDERRIRLVALARVDGLLAQSDLPRHDCCAMINEARGGIEG